MFFYAGSTLTHHVGRILLRQFALSGRSETMPQSRPLVDPCSFDGPPEHACSPVSGREAIGRQNELVALGRLVEAFCEQFRQLQKDGNPASFLPSWRSVLGAWTRSRLPSHSTSPQRRLRCSLIVRSPPHRLSPNTRRSSLPRTFASTFSLISRLTITLLPRRAPRGSVRPTTVRLRHPTMPKPAESLNLSCLTLVGDACR